MSGNAETWTIVRLLSWSQNYLAEKGVEDARLSAERMLGHVLGVDRIRLYLDFDRPLTPDELAAYKKLLLRRSAREPLQYILGETEFYSLNFKVSPAALIPRPETECLIDEAVNFLSAGERAAPRILDVGTGSGIISVVLAKKIPQSRITAVDISDDALALAADNARMHHVQEQITFVTADFLSQRGIRALDRPFDLIISNPPYIAPEEAKDMAPEVIRYEPGTALFAEDPLIFYRRLAGSMGELLVPDGLLLCEMAANRWQEIKAIFIDNGAVEVETLPDYAGHMRVLKARPQKNTEKM